jgi:hypothetical protein
MRVIPWEVSIFSWMFSLAIGSKKLGQPVPELNFEADRKRGS